MRVRPGLGLGATDTSANSRTVAGPAAASDVKVAVTLRLPFITTVIGLAEPLASPLHEANV